VKIAALSLSTIVPRGDSGVNFTSGRATQYPVIEKNKIKFFTIYLLLLLKNNLKKSFSKKYIFVFDTNFFIEITKKPFLI